MLVKVVVRVRLHVHVVVLVHIDTYRTSTRAIGIMGTSAILRIREI